MENSFFDLNDDFEKIIRDNLSRVKSINKIPTGWTNYVFVAEAAGGRYVFRFPRNDFFAAAIKKEIPFNRFIRNKVKVHTPRLKEGRHNGRVFSIHKMIKGHVLTDVYSRMSFKQKRRLAEDVAEYLTAIQSITPDKFKLELLSAFLTGLAKVNDDNYDFSILDALKEMEKEALLTHGDFNPGNLILDDDFRLAAVLDYAFVSYSCRENDISRLIGRLPQDFCEIMLNAWSKKAGAGLNLARINTLITIWQYVEADYINYMKKYHSDVVLPAPN